MSPLPVYLNRCIFFLLYKRRSIGRIREGKSDNRKVKTIGRIDLKRKETCRDNRKIRRAVKYIAGSIIVRLGSRFKNRKDLAGNKYPCATFTGDD